MNLLKSIDVFREVCKQMSFSLAAEQLNIVPSAVSRQINELEKYLGVRLLQRTTRSISLTQDGHRYLQKMDAISQSVRELKNNKRDKIVEDHIRLTAPPILGKLFLNEALSHYIIQYPSVSLSTTLINREINLIDEGYDLALRVGVLDTSNLIARSLGQFSMTVVASPDYLKAHGQPKHPKELAKHNCLINTLSHSPHRWKLREEKRNFSIKVAGSLEVNDDTTLETFACAGHGIAYLPLYVVSEHIRNGTLIPLFKKHMPEPLPISLIYPSRFNLSKAKRLLIDHVVMQASVHLGNTAP